jgi:gamma-glutamyl-gamma-aminobutyrate hydrolase PuuD
MLSQTSPLNETNTDTLSGKPVATVVEGNPCILRPGTPEYKTALEEIYGKPGLPEGVQPVVDMLGRKIKEEDMALKKGSLTDPSKQQRVLVVRDHGLEFPDLNLRVALVGPPQDCKGFAALFSRAYCTGADSIEDADLVVFTGGPDVDPAYYGETRHCMTYVDEERDFEDLTAYMTCYENGIPMVGVCRGAQFGAVMEGAKLYQHIDGHNGDHSMWDCRQKIHLDKISSVHHQSVIPCEHMEIIAWSHKSVTRWKNDTLKMEGKIADVEAFFCRRSCFFGVQGHPEYKDYNAYSKWFLDYINELVILNEDIDWINNRRRLKPDYLLERELTKKQTERPVLTVVEGDK